MLSLKNLMLTLNYFAWGLWGLAGFSLFMVLVQENLLFIIIAMSLAVSSLFVIALNHIIGLLTDIRDALQGADLKNQPAATSTPVTEPKPVRSAQEISADIKRMQGKI